MPHGADYAAHVHLMPWLVVATALTSCQVFYTNAEVSAGRFGFLLWLVPLHVAYPAILLAAADAGLLTSLEGFVGFFAAAAIARFALAAGALALAGRSQP